MTLTFTIPGVPQQQGSKTFNRSTGFGYEANKNLAPWRKVAISCALDAKHGTEGPLFVGPVAVTLVCYFPRPAAHYGTGRNARQLKPSAPFWHASAPDLDKVQRACGDVLTQAQIVLDDRLIVAWDACKLYGDPRMVVTVVDAAAQLPDPDEVPADDAQEALL